MATEVITPQQIAFFPGNRRKIELEYYDPLLNDQDEKRFRLDLMMPLTGQPLIGMPDWLAPLFRDMDSKGSAAKDVNIETTIEGVTFEGFSTEQSKNKIEIDKGGIELTKEEMGHRHVAITGATLNKFKLVRIAQDEQSLVCLKFSITFRADAGLALWCHKYYGGTFWGSFTITQATLDLSTKDDKQMKLGEQPQSTEESQKNVKEFFDKDKATRAAQKAVSKQPIEEQAAELASAGKGKSKKPN